MITRTMDATFLNGVANHPQVRPFIGGGEHELDLTGLCCNPANIVLVTEAGGWVLQARLPGVYELHTMFLPEGRGSAYFAAAREALNYVFTRTDALEILTRCPDDNGPARMAASMMGFRERFRREGVWHTGAGVSFQALTLHEWVMRDRDALKAGRDFHEALEAAKRAQGSTLPDHPDDEAHDRAAGAAYLMIQRGQTAKAVGWYNLWAIFAGYVTIEALSPTVVDIRDAIVEVRDGRMGVLRCQSAQPLEPLA